MEQGLWGWGGPWSHLAVLPLLHPQAALQQQLSCLLRGGPGDGRCQIQMQKLLQELGVEEQVWERSGSDSSAQLSVLRRDSNKGPVCQFGPSSPPNGARPPTLSTSSLLPSTTS